MTLLREADNLFIETPQHHLLLKRKLGTPIQTGPPLLKNLFHSLNLIQTAQNSPRNSTLQLEPCQVDSNPLILNHNLFLLCSSESQNLFEPSPWFHQIVASFSSRASGIYCTILFFLQRFGLEPCSCLTSVRVLPRVHLLFTSVQSSSCSVDHHSCLLSRSDIIFLGETFLSNKAQTPHALYVVSQKN